MMLISIDDTNPLPIYLQIVRQVKEQILVGDLKPGDEVPSVRELGDALGISLHTARSAYQELSDVRLLVIRLGRKARITMPSDQEAALEEAQKSLAARAREWAVDGLLSGVTRAELLGIMDQEIQGLLAQKEASSERSGETREEVGE